MCETSYTVGPHTYHSRAPSVPLLSLERWEAVAAVVEASSVVGKGMAFRLRMVMGCTRPVSVLNAEKGRVLCDGGGVSVVCVVVGGAAVVVN